MEKYIGLPRSRHTLGTAGARALASAAQSRQTALRSFVFTVVSPARHGGDALRAARGVEQSLCRALRARRALSLLVRLRGAKGCAAKHRRPRPRRARLSSDDRSLHALGGKQSGQSPRGALFLDGLSDRVSHGGAVSHTDRAARRGGGPIHHAARRFALRAVELRYRRGGLGRADRRRDVPAARRDARARHQLRRISRHGAAHRARLGADCPDEGTAHRAHRPASSPLRGHSAHIRPHRLDHARARARAAALVQKEDFAASGGGARHRRSVSSAGEPAGAVPIDARFLERFGVRTVRALERVSGRVEGSLAARHRAWAGEFLRSLRPLCYRSSRFSAAALQHAVS